MNSEELRDLFSSTNITRLIKLRTMRTNICMARGWDKRNVYSACMGKLNEKILFGRPKRRWKNSFKINHKEIIWEGMNFIEFSQDRHE